MENKSPDARLMKIVNILILVVLLVITGLLISLHFRLNRPSTAAAPTVASPQAETASPATPSPAVAPTVTPAPAVAPPVRKSSSKPAATRNYTQAAKGLSPPIQTEPEPAPAVVASAPPAPVVPPPAPAVLPPPAQTEPKKVEVTLPAGSILTVRLIDSLHSDRNRPGDRFAAALDEALFSNGVLVAPRGSTVEGRVVDTRQAGRVSGLAEMSVELDRLLLQNGQKVEIVTDSVTRQGETSKGADAAKIGTGAAIGAVIGAIGGGGRGAAIGAASGAGAGTAGVLLSRGKPVVLAPETRLSFQLRAPVQVEVDPAQSPRLASEATSDSFSPSPPRWEGDQPPRLRRRQ